MEKILKEILEELRNMHYHLDNLETFYKFVNRVEMKGKEEEIKEDKGS